MTRYDCLLYVKKAGFQKNFAFYLGFFTIFAYLCSAFQESTLLYYYKQAQQKQ